MKVVVPKQQTTSGKTEYLPLVPDKDLDTVTKENSIGFTLKTNPASANSTTYKMNARIFVGGETTRVLIRWKRDVQRVCTGLAANTVQDRIRIAETLMRDAPLTLFQGRMQELAQEAFNAALAAATTNNQRNAINANGVDHYQHINHFEPSLQFVLQNLMPKNILQYVKRHVHRECRKPKDMKVSIYLQHLIRINTEEIPSLPPFNEDQSLGPDELVDILLHGTPRAWQKEMDRQGFAPLEHTPVEVVDFMERIEAAEEFDGHTVTGKSKDNGGKKSFNQNGKGNDHSKTGKYCALHGKGNHTTDDCRTIKSQVKKLKSSNDNNDKSTKNVRFASKNKTWSKKADDYKKKSQQELNAMGKVVEKLKKEVNALTKKRKSEDSDEEELHAVERQLEAIDMNGFDIEDLKRSMEANEIEEIET